MAMNSDTLGLAIANTLIGKSVIPPTPDMVVNIQQFWKDVAADVVGHIQEHAEVPSGIPVSTTGNETAQSGATTAQGAVV
jgi:hypothetical protein